MRNLVETLRWGGLLSFGPGPAPRALPSKFQKVLFRVGHLIIFNASKADALKSVEGAHRFELISALGAQMGRALAVACWTGQIACPQGQAPQRLLWKAFGAKILSQQSTLTVLFGIPGGPDRESSPN